MGKIIRVNLSSEHVSEKSIDHEVLRNFIGGVGLGMKLLNEEVPLGTSWSDEQNLFILSTGPLNGTSLAGSGTICAISKGCLTNGGTSSQANGYFGAYLRTSGIDSLVIHGISNEWRYLHIHNGTVDLKDANKLVGKTTRETERIIKKELREKRNKISVYSIGPAGENLVKYAMVFGDRGHVLAHNGLGAIMGSKKLKAIAVSKGDLKPEVKNQKDFIHLCKQINKQAKIHPNYRGIHKYGTSVLYPRLAKNGLLPVKNLTTNYFPDFPKFSRKYYSSLYAMKNMPCWACSLHHCKRISIKKGRYAGLETKDPEYECTAAWGSLIGNNNFESAVFLSDLTDQLGLDCNEAGWTIALVIECFEKGIITQKDTDGLMMRWGNVEAVRQMLLKISRREGFGDILAEGVKRGSELIGKEAVDLGVYVNKGHGPRTHDARARWGDILDYSVGGVGTTESNPVLSDEPFLPQNVALNVVKGKIRQFVDSLVVCNFATMSYSGADVGNLIEALNLATGWDYTAEEAFQMSLRVVNLSRVFNIRHGHTSDMETPSVKYGSAPVDGPLRGKSIMNHWEDIVTEYYTLMGWDKSTGKPLPDTLKRFGLESLIHTIW